MANQDYEEIIGLEVHAELSTKTKIFCSCPTEFGADPNTHVCPVCMAMPGALPVLNEKVVEYAVKAGLATNCSISQDIKNDRKNYFYPDLPKSYQISQFDKPLCNNGYIEIEDDNGNPKKVRILRIHIEEDAGKKLLECTQLLKSMEVREIGEYRGFKMEISFDSVTRNIKLKLKNKFSYTIDLGVDAGGNIIRINNCLENIARDIPLEREKLDNTKLQLENAKVESQKEFPQEQELKDKQRKLDSINAELKINDDDHEILGDEQEELIRNQDEFIEAIDFIKREKYDIMLKNVV